MINSREPGSMPSSRLLTYPIRAVFLWGIPLTWMRQCTPAIICETLGEDVLSGCLILSTIPGDPEPAFGKADGHCSHLPCISCQAALPGSHDIFVTEGCQRKATFVGGQVVRNTQDSYLVEPI